MPCASEVGGIPVGVIVVETRGCIGPCGPVAGDRSAGQPRRKRGEVALGSGAAIAASSACAAVIATGCTLWQVAKDQKLDAAAVRLKETVSALEPRYGALVVVLTRRPAVGEPDDAIVDYCSRETAGGFYFAVDQPGVYSLGAFQDLNGDLAYGPDEPGLDSDDGPTFESAPGDTREGIELVIHPEGRVPTGVGGGFDIRAWVAEVAATGTATTLRHLAALGDVVHLGDPRFGRENGPASPGS
jgi:hypothetical protein